MPTDSTEPSHSSRSRSLFRPAHTTFLRVLIFGMGIVLASSAYAVFEFYHSPYWNGVGLAPSQPVLFSHRHHAGELRLDCRYCHATVETSAFAGMPTTQTCLNCHSQVFTDTAMLQPVIRSATAGEPLRWTRVTRLPDHVYFNHSVHLAQGVSCTVCHGDLGRMALTAKARPPDMRWCIECHRHPESRLQPHERLFAPIESTAPFSSATTTRALSENSSTRHLTNCSTCHH